MGKFFQSVFGQINVYKIQLSTLKTNSIRIDLQVIGLIILQPHLNLVSSMF